MLHPILTRDPKVDRKVQSCLNAMLREMQPTGYFQPPVSQEHKDWIRRLDAKYGRGKQDTTGGNRL